MISKQEIVTHANRVVVLTFVYAISEKKRDSTLITSNTSNKWSNDWDSLIPASVKFERVK